MSIRTQIKRPTGAAATPAGRDSSAPAPVVGNQSSESLVSGRAAPSGATLGHRMDLP